MSAPPPSSPNSINSREFLNLSNLHSIVCDYGNKIDVNHNEMHKIKEQIGQDFLVCRVDHISIPHKLEDHDMKLKAIVVVMVGVAVAILEMMVVDLKVVTKLANGKRLELIADDMHVMF
ncbi:unnamed protein product [Lactuca saligna]|uniref:Uncharacterized protein n=1 Tax=Lactuca saligna TaxID=75948 RepID=A0AA35ZME4_LACSI|nr:unnamed protein product [Lactuca saligna]